MKKCLCILTVMLALTMLTACELKGAAEEDADIEVEYISEIVESDDSNMESADDCLPHETVLEFNNKLYGLVNTNQNSAYDNYNAYYNYNLEKEINSDIIGEYLGEYTTQIDNDCNQDTFKMYRYINCPTTEYDWMPRMIAQSSNGNYYHALIGSVFYEMTSEEVLMVYGILSPKSIVSIESKDGKKITDSAFIDSFYNGLFTNEYGGNDFLQENVYQNTGIDESQIDKLYTKHADDKVFLKVELSNGLAIDVAFTSHNYVTVGNSLYFKVDDAWLNLVSVLKE